MKTNWLLNAWNIVTALGILICMLILFRDNHDDDNIDGDMLYC